MSKTTIYLIRHGEAEGNVFRRLQGQYNSMITPNGFRQIEALSRRFQDIHVDAVYSSDLNRTKLTAGAVYIPKKLPLHTDPRFREIGGGVWENQPFGWLERTDPVGNENFSHHPKIWHVEGSEPYEHYTGRFLRALDEVSAANEGKTIAIFSHGMVLRGSLQELFFGGDENAVQHCENTAVTCVTRENGKYTLEFLNDASHITPEISTLGRQMWWRGDGKKDFNMWYRDAEEADQPLLKQLGFVPEAGQRVRISHLGETPTGALAVRDGTVEFLGLLPEFRGRGLSAQLLGECVALAREKGFLTLQAGKIPEDPAAVRLLEKYGFEGRPLQRDIDPEHQMN